MDSVSERTWDRVGAASGIAVLPLTLGGFALIASGGFAVETGTREEIARIVSSPAPPLVFFGLYLDTLGSLLFVVFAARVSAALRRAEGTGGWLPATAFGAAMLQIAASFGDKIAFWAIFTRSGPGFDLQVATALFDIAHASFGLFALMSAFFVGAAGIGIVRTRALPRWLGWSGVAIGLTAVIGAAPPLLDLAQIVFLPFALWIVATSVAMLVRPGAALPGRVAASAAAEATR